MGTPHDDECSWSWLKAVLLSRMVLLCSSSFSKKGKGLAVEDMWRGHDADVEPSAGMTFGPGANVGGS